MSIRTNEVDEHILVLIESLLNDTISEVGFRELDVSGTTDPQLGQNLGIRLVNLNVIPVANLY